MSKDKIFAEKTRAIGDFNFGEKTAEVFEDMLERSIPLYRETQRMLGEIAAEFAVAGSNVYDLGCSNGITLETLASAISAAGKNVQLIGVDYSQPMLDKARNASTASRAFAEARPWRPQRRPAPSRTRRSWC